MSSPIRSLLSSKQVVVLAGVAGLTAIGAVAAIFEVWWAAAVVAFAILLVIAALAADVHRKVGRSMAQMRSEGAAQRESLDQGLRSYQELAQRLDAIEKARQSAVSELSSLRSQFLTRFDLLNKEFGANSQKLLEVAGSLTGAIEDVEGASGRMRQAISRETSRLSIALDRAMNGMEETLNEVDDLLASKFSEATKEQQAVIERLHTELLSEMDAVSQIHARLRVDGPTPLMGGWAMTPIGMKCLIDLAVDPETSLIVECGSGTSTVLMALAVQRSGRSDVRIISLEHLDEFAALTRSQLDRLGLQDFAEVRQAPLEPYEIEETEYQWYARSGFEDLGDIDVLIVDGPPKATGPMARYPAYPLLRESLSPKAVVILDDTRRSEERAVANQWMEDERLSKRFEQPLGQLVLEYRSG